MTQTSAFWDGTTVGDAPPGENTCQSFHEVWFNILGSGAVSGVVEGYLNELAVTADSPASANVLVATGGVMIAGIFYTSDAIETLAIGANAAGNPRIDLVVLRVSWAAQTVRLAVLPGAAAASPAPPALTQTYGVTWEMALAEIWVPNGFATIPATDVCDRRDFKYDFRTAEVAGPMQNILPNAEFLMLHYNYAGATWTGVGHWTLEAGATINALLMAGLPASRARANGLELISAAGAVGITTTHIRVKGGTTYTIRGWVQAVNAADYGVVEITDNGTGPATETINCYQRNQWQLVTIRHTTVADSTRLTVRLRANALDTARFFSFVVVEGKFPGALPRHTREMVFANAPTEHLSVAPTGAGIAVGARTNFNDAARLLDPMAVISTLTIQDTGSAAAGAGLAQMGIRNPRVVDWASRNEQIITVRGTTNSRDRSRQFTTSGAGLRITAPPPQMFAEVETYPATALSYSFYFVGMQT